MFWKFRQQLHFWLNYLNQPVLNQVGRSVWHPGRFWYFYQVKLLESCLSKTPIKETSQ